MSEIYNLTIEGRPAPKERPRMTMGNINSIAMSVFRVVQKKKLSITVKDIIGAIYAATNSKAYTPTKTKNFEQCIGYIAKSKIKGEKIENPIAIKCRFYIKNRNEGDVDNYAKAVLDGLQIVIKNDKQVQKLYAEKWVKYDENGELITEDKERTEIEMEVMDIPKEEEKPKKRKKKTKKVSEEGAAIA